MGQPLLWTFEMEVLGSAGNAVYPVHHFIRPKIPTGALNQKSYELTADLEAK